MTPLQTPSPSPAVVKTLSQSRSQAVVCGALGCRERPMYVVRHRAYGRRTVCFSHALRLLSRPVNQPTQGAEQRSEAPADAERPEAGACPPTRKPPRTPPTGGKGAIDDGRCGAVVVAVAVAVAVYILHLRESTPRSGTIRRERRLAGDFR